MKKIILFTILAVGIALGATSSPKNESVFKHTCEVCLSTEFTPSKKISFTMLKDNRDELAMQNGSYLKCSHCGTLTNISAKNAK